MGLNYLVVIRQAKALGKLNGATIYRVDDVGVYPFKVRHLNSN